MRSPSTPVIVSPDIVVVLTVAPIFASAVAIVAHLPRRRKRADDAGWKIGVRRGLWVLMAVAAVGMAGLVGEVSGGEVGWRVAGVVGWMGFRLGTTSTVHVINNHDPPPPLQTQIAASFLITIPETEPSADLFGARLAPTTHHLTLLALTHTLPFLPAFLTQPSPLLLATFAALLAFSLLNAIRFAYLDDELETARTRFYVSQGMTVPCGMETAG
ncbi:hypothetical protein HDU96_007617, partial [Phlyctochytrium bullatum]